MTSVALIQWKLSTFDALTVQELYALLQLRTEVFAVEQNCAFQDMDGADGLALHLMGSHAGELLAYARCFPPGAKYGEASIGRVVTRLRSRGCGLGHSLMEQAMSAVNVHWGVQPIRIGAQARLKRFYCGHGFVDVGKPYVEDGIEHVEMVWRP